ncbi:hypothetical protein FEM48_Zijuj10G0083600 [Ziziphus jujuba var. spinosa]|uniref:Uncharacterized protein n=1 Tax=Ziziphus jujuba var. spinosa TaxID=714518 RepID=A0A978UMA7_ZIZJJ|nr:hypothetical protein FEM48_Zijuj10G0083600 [Ziziphus jujuba var. spinosa]
MLNSATVCHVVNSDDPPRTIPRMFGMASLEMKLMQVMYIPRFGAVGGRSKFFSNMKGFSNDDHLFGPRSLRVSQIELQLGDARLFLLQLQCNQKTCRRLL